MKTSITRSLIASLCCTLVACTNPYLAQMDALDADYRAGRISQAEYNRQSESLRNRSDAWAAQNSANAALGAAAIGAAGTIGGALIEADATRHAAHTIADSNKRGGGGGGAKKGGGGGGGGGTKKKKPSGGGGGPPGGGPPPR
ncbi:MAG: hypothetical protein K1X78_07120 [Verrucomicrobiaceae bacterium]|nr:hypothetical protein [Verrucomicrobiaceae bacterium]